MQPYSIIMFIFAGMLLIYAALLSTGDSGLIMREYAAKMKDKKQYAKQLGKVIALVAAAPALSGLSALFFESDALLVPVIILVAGGAAAIYLGTRIMRKAQ